MVDYTLLKNLLEGTRTDKPNLFTYPAYSELAQRFTNHGYFFLEAGAEYPMLTQKGEAALRVLDELGFIKDSKVPLQPTDSFGYRSGGGPDNDDITHRDGDPLAPDASK